MTTFFLSFFLFFPLSFYRVPFPFISHADFFFLQRVFNFHHGLRHLGGALLKICETKDVGYYNTGGGWLRGKKKKKEAPATQGTPGQTMQDMQHIFLFFSFLQAPFYEYM